MYPLPRVEKWSEERLDSCKEMLFGVLILFFLGQNIHNPKLPEDNQLGQIKQFLSQNWTET